MFATTQQQQEGEEVLVSDLVHVPAVTTAVIVVVREVYCKRRR